jgi:hypothetical protein
VCKDGYYNINGESSDWAYCIDHCPAGFRASVKDGEDFCSVGANGAKILQYSFNIPNSFYKNEGVGGTSLGTNSKQAGSAGHPVKDRGINFNGTTDGYIEAPADLVLFYSFSVHAWVLLNAAPEDGALATIFTKDRNKWTAADSGNQLLFAVDKNLKLEGRLANDLDTSVYATNVSTTAITAKAWQYVALSAKLKSDTKADTDLTFYINNAAHGSETLDDVFNIDSHGYHSYIGIRRVYKASDPEKWEFTDRWNGYMYMFFVH